MREVYRLDAEGFYKEPVHLKDGEGLPNDCVEDAPDSSLYKAKRVNGRWENGLTPEEILSLEVVQPSEMEVLKKQQADLVFELMLKGVL